ncbi:hypothetical protein [Martelella radicis]|uniref:Uncharacterized protein n=1 Tax=Martelella radicis TaxID=1397476 RepID=A0A7W6PAC6_9HYPH|nr:hypothetical protein [Martelella radicis]MBB4123202.1 hypothetical protein [Martelella radicis]
MGDSYGPAAIDLTPRSLTPLAQDDIQPMRFGGNGRAMPSIPPDFTDQHSLMRRDYPKVETRLALAAAFISPGTLQLLA